MGTSKRAFPFLPESLFFFFLNFLAFTLATATAAAAFFSAITFSFLAFTLAAATTTAFAAFSDVAFLSTTAFFSAATAIADAARASEATSALYCMKALTSELVMSVFTPLTGMELHARSLRRVSLTPLPPEIRPETWPQATAASRSIPRNAFFREDSLTLTLLALSLVRRCGLVLLLPQPLERDRGCRLKWGVLTSGLGVPPLVYPSPSSALLMLLLLPLLLPDAPLTAMLLLLLLPIVAIKLPLRLRAPGPNMRRNSDQLILLSPSES